MGDGRRSFARLKISDNGSYVAIAFAALFLVGWGFARSFFLLPWRPSSTLPPLLVLHGIVLTSWVVLFAIQVALAASRNARFHRRIGILGFPVAVGVVTTGSIVLVRAAARVVPPSGLPFGIVLVAFDGLHLLAFAAFVTGGLALRRKRGDGHERLMVLATLSLLPPALGRAFGPLLHETTPRAVFLTLVALSVVAFAIDTARTRRAHSAYRIGVPAFVAIAFVTYIAQTSG